MLHMLSPVSKTYLLNFSNTELVPLLLTLSILLFIFLIFRKRFHDAFFLFLSMSSGIILTLLLKWIFGLPRPLDGFLYAPGFSFPSGHASIATIFFLTFIYLFISHVKNTVIKSTLEAACIALVVLIGFSRIYLGVHWVGDVLGGIALGVLCVSVSSFFCNIKFKPASLK